FAAQISTSPPRGGWSGYSQRLEVTGDLQRTVSKIGVSWYPRGVSNPLTTMDELRQAQQAAQSGDLPGAARICRDLIHREPANFFALLMLGGIESDRKNFAEAGQLLGRAVKLNPRSPEALATYGNVLIELGRREDGVRALSEAIRLQPQNAATYIYRGYGHAQSADHEKALADFDTAVRLAPGWEFALHNRATALIAR